VIARVSFFGAALFWVTGSGAGVGPPAVPGPGFSGTVGRPPRVGGLGGVVPASGFGANGGPGGLGGGTKGFPASLPAGAPPTGSLVVSFFGAVPTGGIGFPGTLMRTVSRFTAG
jgi:hypothetical protein